MSPVSNLLAAAVTLAVLSTAAVPPALSETVFLPGDDTLAPAAGKQLLPEIAAGGSNFLVVWVDDRAALTDVPTMSGGPAFDHHIGTMWDLYAARVDVAGSPIDTTPIFISRDIQNQGLPDVAWNGTNWLVIFTGQEGLQCCPTDNRYAVRVAADGGVLDPVPITLATGTFADAAWPAAVGSDGTNWLVVWTTNGNRVTAMRVAPDGTVLDPAGVVLYTGGSPGDYDITFTNGQYFLVWSSGGRTGGGTILGLRFDANLTPAGAAFPINLYSPTVGRNCSVATNGNGFFVAWWEDRYYGWSQVVGARVSAAGTVLDPGGISLTTAYGYSNYEPAVSWDGTNWVALYDPYTLTSIDVLASRVTPGGTVLDFDTNALPLATSVDSQWEAAIARTPGGNGTLAVWRDARYTGSGLGDIFARPIDPNGTLGTEQCVALGAPRQTALRLVPNGAGHLAVFLSETAVASRVLLQRLGSSGAALDLEPIQAATGGAEVRNPSAAWDGAEYLVVWEDEPADQVYGRRFAADLTPLDSAPVALLRGNRPDVAAVGGVFLVTSLYEQPHEIQQVYSQRVRGSDGAILDASPPVVGVDHARNARVAAFSDRWLVTWQRHPTHDDPFSSIMANFVAADGTPGTELLVDAPGTLPAVDVGGTQALIAWDVDTGPTVEDRDVLARRILSNGTFLDANAFTVSGAVNAQFDAAVGWTGTEYGVAFGDFRNDAQYDSKPGDLYAARVADTGVVLDPLGFAVANDQEPEMLPDVAGVGGELLIGGAMFRPETGYANYRIGIVPQGPVAGVDAPEVASVRPGLGAWPNPFTASTNLSFELPKAGRVQLSIHDAAGRLVRTLIADTREQGFHTVAWDAADRSGRRVGAGVYFVRFEAQSFRASQRLVLLR